MKDISVRMITAAEQLNDAVSVHVTFLTSNNNILSLFILDTDVLLAILKNTLPSLPNLTVVLMSGE